MSVSDFTHYLITRFNILIDSFGPERMTSPPMNDLDVQHRLDLFEKYCVPSVWSQTSNNFTWLLYFDMDTNPEVLDRIRNITAGPVSVQIILVKGFEDFLKSIKDFIRQSPSLFCITTRLDNDDLISDDYIAEVQRHFIPAHRTLINFTKGFEIDLTNHIIKRWSTRYRNQFTSLIEDRRSTDVLSVYGFAHGAVPEDIGIVNVGGTAKWAYTRHEFNHSPQKINARPVFSTKSLNRFHSLRGHVNISWWNTARYTSRWFWKTSRVRLKNYARKAVKK